MPAILAITCGYLLGSFPTAYLAGRLKKGIDIRQVGSHNMGTMNVLYEVGIAEGILVFIIDIGKGIAPIIFARWLGMPLLMQFGAGVAALIGHTFPVFLKFRGGKGGATSIGILCFLMPEAIPFYFGIAAVSLLITRNLIFGYVIAFASFPLIGWLSYHSGTLVALSVTIILFLLANNIPGIKKIYARGDYRHTIFHSSIKDRDSNGDNN